MGLELTVPAIVSLAAVDAINPCALAVLTFMLIAFLTHNPKEKKKALFAGLAFTSAVYMLYLFYAVVLIGLLHTSTEMFGNIEGFVYGFFSLFAIALGCFNVKDFLWYKPGGFMREMPMSWRPRIKKILSGVASVKGAFLVGLFVTLFLLPCTAGPLVTACVLLMKLGIINALPWLLLYNIIFVSPMLAITFGLYAGLLLVENVSEWRARNIRYLHLIAVIVMVLIGIYLAWEAENVFTFSLAGFKISFLTLGVIEIPVLFTIFYLVNKGKADMQN